MRRILALSLIHKDGSRMREAASILNAVEVYKAVLHTIPLSQDDARQCDLVPTDFLMLFDRLNGSRGQRSLKAHDTADPAGRSGGCRRGVVRRCSVIFSLLGRATESEKRHREQ